MELIDLRLVLTQALGFILFVWILARFAWKPMLGLLEARRQRIADEFAEAERRQAEADRAKARYEHEIAEIARQARAKLQEAVAEGQRVAGEIRTQAQHEAQERMERARDEISRETEKAKELLKEHVVHLSVRGAEKILRKDLDDPAHRKLVREFIDEVGAKS